MEYKVISEIKEIDVGIFTTESHKYYFLNILGFGFVSDVAKSAHRLKKVGNLAYILGVFYQLLFLKTHYLTIEIDGKLIECNRKFAEIFGYKSREHCLENFIAPINVRTLVTRNNQKEIMNTAKFMYPSLSNLPIFKSIINLCLL